jgi:hypothetical protein
MRQVDAAAQNIDGEGRFTGIILLLRSAHDINPERSRFSQKAGIEML